MKFNYFSHLLYAFVALAALVATNNVVFAHGNTEPQHGGKVKVMGDYSFELVRSETLTELYVAFDGHPIDAEKSKALLKIDNAGKKHKVTLQSATENRFYIKGTRLEDGSKVMAIVTLPDGYSKIVAKFKL